MAARGSNKTTGGRKPATKPRAPKRTTQANPRPALLRPEHQRDLFALSLITIALVTIIFFATGVAGGIGALYVAVVRQAFGAGALVVPITLGLLGLAILIQEQFHDSQLSAANVVGTLLIITSILGLLELPIYPLALDLRTDEGGGWFGFWLIQLSNQAIGLPATTLVLVVLGLAGVLLTFNLTLRELLIGLAQRSASFWAMLWGGPRHPRAPRATLADADLPFTPPPQGEDLVPTPIAARPTRASLFQRPGKSSDAPAPKPEPAEAAAAKPSAKSGAAQPKAAPAKAKAQAQPPEQAKAAEATPEVEQEELEGFALTQVHRAWPLPPLDMLEQTSSDGRMGDPDIRSLSRTIEDTLASFKVEAQVVNVNPGPAVTQFEVQPAVGVKVSKITSLEKDLALALAASSIRIEAPIPGKSAVGIEIPNSSISVVGLREVVDSEEFELSKGRMKLPLGKDISGNPVVADMTRMPHLLVAGATGSGKSVAVNAFLCGLLLRHTPDELKMILIDPKMVEMIVYNQIPHLLSPVVTELERVVPTLKWATREMERRYKIFARHGVRNLDSYKQLARKRADLEPMPYILIVIDELADLMMMAPDEVETHICRLAQMARATGIHLIIATQRPSVDVITGLIKANFPSRIAFAVTSQVDSRVILDVHGADQLLGRGDMLYMAADAAKLVRIQGTFVSDREVEKLVAFWRQATPPDATPSGSKDSKAAQQPGGSLGMHGPPFSGALPGPAPSEANSKPKSASPPPPADETFRPPAEFLSADEQDALLPQAIDLVQQHQRASASLLQRRLRIGYSKASQLIDLLEQQGIVGPPEGGRSREVLRRQ
ncbi:FtsK/SpoIIIE family DNA translocase [Candidatus Viridilinea mediisalina]|uniref:Cell division protein FtsK n=1 Tax=Candidatus Viridilinea mediisalina TaxID=2024553 RepID=A0A2A6RG03_9CHLR|nr:DNA translocase FtsK [Candidatus Viridilinea mediisalina]PDW01809.1 cell division protein FtsK [Candidatus Viridilinea mediisalina]